MTKFTNVIVRKPGKSLCNGITSAPELGQPIYERAVEEHDDYIAALKQCGLEGREGEYVWQLSGGQTHLLALAGAVSLQPDILILDEPIAQLDPMHADRIYGGAPGAQRDLWQDHHRHRAPHGVHRRLLPPRDAHEGRPGAVDAPHDEALRG